MFKFQSIEMGADYLHGYDEGARPGVKCVVTMQTGEHSYDKAEFKLSPEAVRRVVKFALEEVRAMFEIDGDNIDVVGAPGAPKPEPVNVKAEAYDEVVL